MATVRDSVLENIHQNEYVDEINYTQRDKRSAFIMQVIKEELQTQKDN